MRFAELSSRAKALRIAHIAIAGADLTSLGYVWFCALSRRRDRLLAASVATLSLQGVALVIGRGNCPLGPLQERVGDPGPLFELVLPPRAAKAAIPVFFAVALSGAAILGLRGRATQALTASSVRSLPVIFGVVCSGRAGRAPFAVGAYIAGAYWFTASTSFANPAVTLARTLTDTFDGIAPESVVPSIAAQLVGALAATALARWFYPTIADVAEDLVIRRSG